MLEPGQPIGNYRIVRELGQGGMGAVFEAVHQDIGRHVAIKVLHQGYARDPEIAARFLNEARAAAIVDHPGIVDVFEYGRLPDGTTYLVMEYVKGPSLRALLKQEAKLLVRDALRISRQIAVALAAAHEKGIIHRELSPLLRKPSESFKKSKLSSEGAGKDPLVWSDAPSLTCSQCLPQILSHPSSISRAIRGHAR